MFAKTLKLAAFAACLLLSGCATTQSYNITRVNWPPAPQDEIDVRASLTQLVHANPALKVVLRVPNVSNNVTQSQTGQSGSADTSLNGAYDIIEKRLFKAGFVVRDRALLNNLMNEKGITSYKEIQSRVDTDLIIDVSSLKFDDPQDWLVSQDYITDSQEAVGGSGRVGEAVATVEAKFIVVSTGEVGGIVTLHVPICQSVNCTFNYYNFSDDLNGVYDIRFTANSQDAGYIASQDNQTGQVTYLWGPGAGPGGINHAADLIAQKIVDALTH
jgi:hypothetical protein